VVVFLEDEIMRGSTCLRNGDGSLSVRYELLSAEIEICHKNRNMIHPGCSLFRTGSEKMIFKAPDRKQLLDAVGACSAEITEKASLQGTLYRVREYIAQESFYSAEGELLVSNIVGFSKFNIGVLGTKGELLDVFDSFAAAERLSSSCGGTISFLSL